MSCAFSPEAPGQKQQPILVSHHGIRSMMSRSGSEPSRSGEGNIGKVWCREWSRGARTGTRSKAGDQKHAARSVTAAGQGFAYLHRQLPALFPSPKIVLLDQQGNAVAPPIRASVGGRASGA